MIARSRRSTDTVLVSTEDEDGKETEKELRWDSVCETAQRLWSDRAMLELAEHHGQCDECTVRAVMQS